MTLDEAFLMIAMHGNVCSDVKLLLNTKPTLRQLDAAIYMCKQRMCADTDEAAQLIKEHHGL